MFYVRVLELSGTLLYALGRSPILRKCIFWRSGIYLDLAEYQKVQQKVLSLGLNGSNKLNRPSRVSKSILKGAVARSKWSKEVK